MLKEKEIKEYKIGLARAALGMLKRKRDGGEPQPSTSSKGSNGEDAADVSKFESLQWRQEMTIIAKRRKLEEECEAEILATKKKVLQDEMNADPNSLAEEDEVPRQNLSDAEAEIVKLGQEVSNRKVTDVQSPAPVLKQHMGEYISVSYFRSYNVRFFYTN